MMSHAVGVAAGASPVAAWRMIVSILAPFAVRLARMAEASCGLATMVLIPTEIEMLGVVCALMVPASVNVRLAATGVEVAEVELPKRPPVAPVASMRPAAVEDDVQDNTCVCALAECT